MSAYLIRLMTSTMMPQTRDAACETLFVLCDKDGKYVNNGQEIKKAMERKREGEEERKQGQGRTRRRRGAEGMV